MSRRMRFWDNAGFGNHCWECENSTEWQGEDGKCTIYGIKVTKHDSPNNICSVGRICHNYTRETKRKPDIESRWHELFGTPERAANVILALQICPCGKDECVFCPAHDVCFEHYKGDRTVYEMAEWLRGDA